jgi:uncharacterized repeat protein (TIGR03803 family)
MTKQKWLVALFVGSSIGCFGDADQSPAQSRPSTASSAQTFTNLASFNGSDGEFPWNTPLVQGLDGDFYGTTNKGGISSRSCGAGNSCGTVFKITANGALTTLYKFCSQINCTDGVSPYAGLVLATDGNFYGTTPGGGTHSGTVFRITPAGKLTTIYDFCSLPNCSDGGGPIAGLVQGADGDFYGTSPSGGANNAGVVFKVTPTGKLTTLYSFCAQTGCADGQLPYTGLVQATDGNFYGTTEVGGTSGNGTVFKITPAGKLTILHRFDGADGSEPAGGLVQATDGNFYGMAEYGGANNEGTVFKITPAGALTTLYSFCAKANCADGQLPQYAELIQTTDGNFYGMTSQGGAHASTSCGFQGPGSCGTIFKITPEGALTTLYSFCAQTNCADGGFPFGGLVQATNGKLYGTTLGDQFVTLCSASDCGTVFSISVGLRPFVETLPGSGKAGAVVKILGNNLTGATEVSFHGTAAKFTVVSSTEIETSVPSGATTGLMAAKVPSGTLSSNVLFRVIP